MRHDFTDAAYLQAVRARAHRERAEAVHRLLIAPVLRLFTIKAHASRSHFARQG
jgi:hypothetical protein